MDPLPYSDTTKNYVATVIEVDRALEYLIQRLEEAGKLATVFHAGTKLGDDGAVLTAGGRVLGVTATGKDLEDAIAKAYAACKPISFQDMHFRTDIGKV